MKAKENFLKGFKAGATFTIKEFYRAAGINKKLAAWDDYDKKAALEAWKREENESEN